MTTDAERNKMLEKIKALANLANPENGGTQGEIETAAAMMQKLMDKYNISMLEVMQEKKDDPKFFTSQEVKYRMAKVKPWHWSLARAIDRIVGTRHFSTSSWGKSDREKGRKGARNIRLGVMCFYGTKENVQIACDLYDKWVERIDTMSTTATSAYIEEMAKDEYIQARMQDQGVKQVRFLKHLGNRHPQSFRASWLDGCIAGIHTALFEQEQARKKEKVTIRTKVTHQPHSNVDSPDDVLDNVLGEEETVEETSTAANAMVLYNANLTKAFKDFTTGFRSVNTTSHAKTNYDGYAKGHQVGKSINLTSKELKG